MVLCMRSEHRIVELSWTGYHQIGEFLKKTLQAGPQFHRIGLTPTPGRLNVSGNLNSHAYSSNQKDVFTGAVSCSGSISIAGSN